MEGGDLKVDLEVHQFGVGYAREELGNHQKILEVSLQKGVHLESFDVVAGSQGLGMLVEQDIVAVGNTEAGTENQVDRKWAVGKLL